MENKKEIAIDMDKLILRVYNKIALWNNQDATSEDKSIMLKVLSHDIVSDIITSAFSGLEGVKIKEKIIASESKKTKGFIKKILGGR